MDIIIHNNAETVHIVTFGAQIYDYYRKYRRAKALSDAPDGFIDTGEMSSTDKILFLISFITIIWLLFFNFKTFFPLLLMPMAIIALIMAPFCKSKTKAIITHFVSIADLLAIICIGIAIKVHNF